MRIKFWKIEKYIIDRFLLNDILYEILGSETKKKVEFI